MAVSKKRKKNVYTPPRDAGLAESNPRWLVPTMITFLIAGVVWIVAYYIMGSEFPVQIGNLNIIIGFGLLLVGFVLTTRWK